jgi:hypothetical protein
LADLRRDPIEGIILMVQQLIQITLAGALFLLGILHELAEKI